MLFLLWELVLLIPVQVQPFHVVADGGMMDHSFIIPRPKQIIKRKIPENQGKTPSFQPTSCPEPAGQGGGLRRPGLALKKLKQSSKHGKKAT